jgi:hypothetical protein
LKSDEIVRVAIVVAALLAGFGSQLGFRLAANAQSKGVAATVAPLTAAERAKAAIAKSGTIGKTNVPFPPEKAGCYRLSNGQWQELPCASQDFIEKHYQRPANENSIQAIRHEIGIRGRGFSISTPPTPIILSSVDIGMEDTQHAAETDVYNPPPTPTNLAPPAQLTSNSYSIQNNTNIFNCTNCARLFPAQSGISNSAGTSSDQAWVQFVFQSGDPPAYCIWYVDVTVAGMSM